MHTSACTVFFFLFFFGCVCVCVVLLLFFFGSKRYAWVVMFSPYAITVVSPKSAHGRSTSRKSARCHVYNDSMLSKQIPVIRQTVTLTTEPPATSELRPDSIYNNTLEGTKSPHGVARSTRVITFGGV